MLPRKKSEYVLGTARTLPWLFCPAVETAPKFHDYRKGNRQGMFLSGGLDSSTVAALATKIRGDRMNIGLPSGCLTTWNACRRSRGVRNGGYSA